MKKSVKKISLDSRQILAKNGLFAWIIMFFAALLSASVLMLDIIFADLFILIVPFIVLPLMFAFQRAVIALREEDTLSFGLIWEGLKQYFSPRFSSNYRVLKTVLKLLIVYGISLAITMIVVNLSFYYTNYMGYRDLFASISVINLDSDTLNHLLETNRDLLRVFAIYSNVPPLFFVCLFGLFFFSINSESFFIRISGVKYPGAFITELNKRMIRSNRGQFYKVYFCLNWPLYLLFVLGFILGGYIGYRYSPTFSSIFAFGLSFAVLISFSLYGAIYFANKEAIYFAFIPEIQDEDNKFKEELRKELVSFAPPETVEKMMNGLEEDNHQDEE